MLEAWIFFLYLENQTLDCCGITKVQIMRTLLLKFRTCMASIIPKTKMLVIKVSEKDQIFSNQRFQPQKINPKASQGLPEHQKLHSFFLEIAANSALHSKNPHHIINVESTWGFPGTTVTQSWQPWSFSSPIRGRIWTATLTQQSSPEELASIVSTTPFDQEKIQSLKTPPKERKAKCVQYV